MNILKSKIQRSFVSKIYLICLSMKSSSIPAFQDPCYGPFHESALAPNYNLSLVLRIPSLLLYCRLIPSLLSICWMLSAFSREEQMSLGLRAIWFFSLAHYLWLLKGQFSVLAIQFLCRVHCSLLELQDLPPWSPLWCYSQMPRQHMCSFLVQLESSAQILWYIFVSLLLCLVSTQKMQGLKRDFRWDFP